MTDLMVASSISSGSGHAIPCARAALKTSDTVDWAHPHECAMPSWLTPIAANRRISLYLTIFSSFLSMASGALCAKAILEKGKARDAGPKSSVKRGTIIGATWNRYRSCTQYAITGFPFVGGMIE